MVYMNKHISTSPSQNNSPKKKGRHLVPFKAEQNSPSKEVLTNAALANILHIYLDAQTFYNLNITKLSKTSPSNTTETLKALSNKLALNNTLTGKDNALFFDLLFDQPSTTNHLIYNKARLDFPTIRTSFLDLPHIQEFINHTIKDTLNQNEDFSSANDTLFTVLQDLNAPDSTDTIAPLTQKHPLLAFSYDESGTPALNWAIAHRQSRIIALLLDAGAHVNTADNGGFTPLHEAAMTGQVNVACRLLSNGADITARDEDGETPLHWAARHGNPSMKTLFINAGADNLARDNTGITPLQIAMTNASFSVQ